MTTNPKNDLTCEICRKPFDLENYLPKCLACCGKSLCRKCLQSLLKKSLCECPWCKTRIRSESEAFKTNLQLLNLIEEDSKWEKCPQHGESIKLVCLKDRRKLCPYCGLSSECKNHDLVHLIDIKRAFGERLKEVQGGFAKVEGKATKYEEAMKMNKERFEGIMNESFDKQIEELKQMKAKTLMKLNSAFEEKQNSMANSFGQQCNSLRVEIQAKIYEHFNFFKTKDPVRAIQEDMSNLKARVDSLLGESQVESFELDLLKLVGLFEKKPDLDQKEGFDVLINSLKGGVSQKIEQPKREFFENTKAISQEEREREICVQVCGMRFHFQASSGILTCGCDLDKRMKTVILEAKQVGEIAEVFISIGSFDLNEVNMKAIEDVLAEIVQISRISLFLQSTLRKIPLERLSYLFKIIFRKPQEINQLNISFPPKNDFVMSFNALMSQFSSLKNLKVLFFPGEYSSEACEDFVKNLSFLAFRLERLDLNFSGTNFPISALKRIFIYMPKLEEFLLNVSRMADFDDLALSLMTRGMENLMPKVGKFHIEALQTGVPKHFVEDLKTGMNWIPQISIASDDFKKKPLRQSCCGCCDSCNSE